MTSFDDFYWTRDGNGKIIVPERLFSTSEPVPVNISPPLEPTALVTVPWFIDATPTGLLHSPSNAGRLNTESHWIQLRPLYSALDEMIAGRYKEEEYPNDRNKALRTKTVIIVQGVKHVTLIKQKISARLKKLAAPGVIRVTADLDPGGDHAPGLPAHVSAVNDFNDSRSIARILITVPRTASRHVNFEEKRNVIFYGVPPVAGVCDAFKRWWEMLGRMNAVGGEFATILDTTMASDMEFAREMDMSERIKGPIPEFMEVALERHEARSEA